MDLDVTKLQQLDSKKILESFLSIIKKIYKSIDYTNMNEEEFYDLVLKEINASKKTYKGDISYIDYLKKKINISLNKYISDKLLEPNSAVTIIDSYINTNLKKVFECEDAIKNLKKLDSFFRNHNYISSPDVLIRVIENNKYFSNMIKLIVEKYRSKIEQGEIESIFDNYTIVSLIGIYCMLNNIEIKEELDIDENDYEIDYENENYKNSTDDDLYSSDIVKTYLREIQRRPLLSIEKERELAQKISQGDEEAKKIFIESNLKLVVSIAKRYIGRGLLFIDLIQEGNIGLMKAVDKYDVTRGNKFSTHATWWIRQAITRSIADKGRNIRIPVHLLDKLNKYNRVTSLLESKLNRTPTIEEIAYEMGETISTVEDLASIRVDTLSMNSLVGDKEESELEDFIPSLIDTPEEIAIKEDLNSKIKQLLDDCNLTEKEKKVIRLRFGLDDGMARTLEQIGPYFNVTRERIRQIEAKALKKIRKSKYIKAFADYTSNPTRASNNIDEYKDKYRSTGSNIVYLDDEPVKKNNNGNIKSTHQSLIQPPLSKQNKVIQDSFRVAIKEENPKPLSKVTVKKKGVNVSYFSENKQNTQSKTVNVDLKNENLQKQVEIKNSEHSKEQPNSVVEDSKTKTGIGPKIVKEKGKERSNMKRTYDIYEHFKKYNYTKEQVDKMLSKLTSEERNLINLKTSDNLSEEHRKRYNSRLMPKMKKLLENPNYKPRRTTKGVIIDKSVLEAEEQERKKSLPEVRIKKMPIRTDILSDKQSDIVSEPSSKENVQIQEDIIIKKEDEEEQSNTRIKIGPYEYFKKYNYTKEQIDEAILKLTPHQRELVELRISGKATGQQTHLYNSNVIPKLKRLLDTNYMPKSQKTILSKVSSEEAVLDSTVISDVLEEVNIYKPELKEFQGCEKQEETLDTECFDVTKNDYIKMLELLRTPSFSQMMSVLSVKESVIISLKLGYVDEKYFSNESIAQFLQIDEEEVRETIKKILLLYKENINQFIDNAIMMATEQTSDGSFQKTIQP